MRERVNPFVAKRKLKAFANIADSGETVHNEQSLLKSTLFATYTLNFTKFPVAGKMVWSNFQHERVDFVKFSSEGVNLSLIFLLLSQSVLLLVIGYGYPFNYRDFLFFDKLCS